MSQLLEPVERGLSSMNEEESTARMVESFRKALKEFNAKAASLGAAEVERAGRSLLEYLDRELAPAAGEEALAVFGFAVNALIEVLQDARSEGPETPLQVEEVLEILGAVTSEPAHERLRGESASPTSKGFPEGDFLASEPGSSGGELDPPFLKTPRKADASELESLGRVAAKLDGKLSVKPDQEEAESVQLTFPADADIVRKIETLLSSGDPEGAFAAQLEQDDEHITEVLNTIREFMGALSAGDVKGARVILLLLAKQQHQAGLYDEIGSITRDLHDSLRNFVDSLDSALKGLVEDEISSTENRLERVLKQTEKAANTTLDHVERMQRRNRDDVVRIKQLRLLLGRFKVAGKAQEHMTVIQDLLDEVQRSTEEDLEDLMTVLTAQDYQDLTGQVIIKVMELLKDLELKLVKVISTFGFKVEYLTQKADGKEMEETERDTSVTSQDDVDKLLGELGF